MPGTLAMDCFPVKRKAQISWQITLKQQSLFQLLLPEILFSGFSFVIQHFKSKSCFIEMNVFEF